MAKKQAEGAIVVRLYDRFYELYTYRELLGMTEKWDKWEAQSLPGHNLNKSGTTDDNDARSTMTDINVEGASKLKSPMTWSTVWTVVALASDQATNIELIAQSEEDRHKTVVLKEVFDYAWDKSRGNVERTAAFIDICRYGTAIWKEYYRTDTRQIKDIKSWNPFTEELVYEEREIEDYNDVYGKSIDIRSFYIDNAATNMEDARDCFERMILPMESFNQLYPTKKYPNADKVVPGSHFLGLYDERENQVFPEIGEDEVEVLEYYNKVRDERHIVANGVLLTPLISPIPYKHKQLPYARSVFFMQDRQHFYGIGIPEVLEHHQAARDTVWNIMIDRMKLALNKPMFISPGSDLTDEDMVLYPGKVIEINEPSTAVREMQIDAPDGQSFSIIDKIDTEAKYLIGADDPIFGVKSGGTATENAIAKEASLKKMKMFFQLFEAETMTRIGRLRLSNIQQLYSVPLRIKKIVGRTVLGKFTSGLPQQLQDALPGKKEVTKLEPEYRKFPLDKKKMQNALNREEWVDREGQFTELKPDDYMGVFDIKVIPTTTLPISKSMERKEFSEMLQGLGTLQPAMQLINWKKLLVDYLHKWDVDGDDYIVDQESQFEKVVKLAVDENDRMIEGEPLPFTRGVPPEHSQRHEALIFSKDFATFDGEIQRIIVKHYEGELKEQQMVEAQQRLDKLKSMRFVQPEQPPQEQAIPEGAVPVNPQTGLPEGMTDNEAMGLQPPQPGAPLPPPQPPTV